MGKKRLNPNTNKEYKSGDYNLDKTKRFHSYRVHVNNDGYFSERWFENDKYDEVKKKAADKQRRDTSSIRKLNLPKRINEKTGKEFKPGELNDSGQYFIGYARNQKTSLGYRGESWGTKEAWVKARIGNTIFKIKKRAVKNNIPYDINITYLYSIYPLDDTRCPILDIKMDFAGDRFSSPSIDRLVPENGYVKGNVAWVSLLANVVKRERTPEELRLIADWIEKQPIYQKSLKSNFQ